MKATILHDRPMSSDAFPEIAPLVAAAKADGIDARAVLARVLTDLFIGRKMHVATELEQFAALVEPLVRAIDMPSAITVARKLAAHAETPRAVIEALLARDDEASHATLRDAVMLDQRTLDILAERGSRPPLRARRRRRGARRARRRPGTPRRDAGGLARPAGRGDGGDRRGFDRGGAGARLAQLRCAARPDRGAAAAARRASVALDRA